MKWLRDGCSVVSKQRLLLADAPSVVHIQNLVEVSYTVSLRECGCSETFVLGLFLSLYVVINVFCCII